MYYSQSKSEQKLQEDIMNTHDDLRKNSNITRNIYLAFLIIIGLIVLVGIVTRSPSNQLTEAEKQQQEAEKQRIAQMNEALSRAYDGDLLEFRDGHFAVVTNKNDFGLVTKYSIGASGRQSYETLARNVVAVYTKDHPDRCLVLEKFIASF